MKHLRLTILTILFAICHAGFAQEIEQEDETQKMMLSINNAVNEFSKAFTTRHIILDEPGTLLWYTQKMSDNILSTLETLKISGPINGTDVVAIHSLMGKDSKYPNIKTLDLSRAWVVSDSAIFNGYVSDMNHEYFANLKGKRTKLSLEDFKEMTGLDDYEGPFDVLRDKWGYAVEIIPDELYFSFTATIEDCIMREMLSNLPYVRHIKLPESTKSIHFRAVRNCPNLREVTIPQSVELMEAGVFAGDSMLTTVYVHEDSQLLQSEQFDLQNKDYTAFPGCSEKLQIKTYSNKLPDVTFTMHITGRPSTSPLFVSNMSHPYYQRERKTLDFTKGEVTFTMTAPLHSLIFFNNLPYSFIAEQGAHYEIDLYKKYSAKGSPMTEKFLGYAKVLSEIQRAIDKENKAIAQETSADSIRSISKRIHEKQFKFEATLVKAYKENMDNTIGACLLEMFHEDMNPYMVQGLLSLMNDKNAFDEVTRFAWRMLKEKSAIDEVDWNEYADTAQMEKVHVEKPGTLRSLKTDDEWRKVQRLYLSGELNGDDLAFLSDLASVRSKIVGARLFSIDMREVQLKTLSEKQFAHCNYLRFIRLPETLQSIAKMTFYDSPGLQNVIMPQGLKRIGYGAFALCSSLKYIFIPDSVKVIENEAFDQCRRLRIIHLPEQLDTLGARVFDRCLNLKRLHFPASMRHLASTKFQSCPELILTIDPKNPYYEVIENHIVANWDRKKKDEDARWEAKFATDEWKKKEKEWNAGPQKFRSTYKMVNGKRVLVKRVPLK